MYTSTIYEFVQTNYLILFLIIFTCRSKYDSDKNIILSFVKIILAIKIAMIVFVLLKLIEY